MILQRHGKDVLILCSEEAWSLQLFNWIEYDVLAKHAVRGDSQKCWYSGSDSILVRHVVAILSSVMGHALFESLCHQWVQSVESCLSEAAYFGDVTNNGTRGLVVCNSWLTRDSGLVHRWDDPGATSVQTCPTAAITYSGLHCVASRTLKDK